MCCCGGIGVVIFGMNVISAEVADQLRDNQKFREHIGELEEINVDFVASAAKDEDDTFVYKVKGAKGRGPSPLNRLLTTTAMKKSLKLPSASLTANRCRLCRSA